MRVIFLDVDGVLNNKATIAMGVHLDNQKLVMLSRFVDEYDLDVIISSSWRGAWEIQDLKEVLRVAGFKAIHKIVGYTPRGFGFACRGEEIQSVLDANKDKIESYVIFDDDSDMLESQEANFVQTTFDIGLTYQHLDAAKQILFPEISS